MSELINDDFLNEVIQFNSIDEKISKLKEWKLLSKKTNELKNIYYKDCNNTYICDAIGYLRKKTGPLCLDEYYETVVIKVDNRIIKICPAYLLEMQKKDFSLLSVLENKE